MLSPAGARAAGSPRSEEGPMRPVLIIGLLWLSVGAVLCLLIGRAIRHADRHEEKLARRAATARLGAPQPGRGRDRRGQVTVLAPLPEDLLRRPGIPRAGGRSPMVFRPQDSDAATPDGPHRPDGPPRED
jgi:hypothetical protein